MALVYLALGSNVGNGNRAFDKAISLLTSGLSNIKQAPRYSSKAVGFVDQPDFLNTVVSGDTDLEPKDLLSLTQYVEQQIGRIKRFRWGPREIDIDIIFYDTLMIDEPDLTIPHPRFPERDFVLKPLCDLDPEFIDPVSKLTVHELYEKLPTDSRAIKD